MLALTYLSAIRFSGADAGDFLHNQLSADVLALAVGESVFACYCEPKGRVLTLMLVSRDSNDYKVIMSRSLVSSIAQRLAIFVMRAKVNIEILEKCTIAGFHAGDELPPALPVRITVPDSTDILLILDDDTTLVTNPALEDAWKLAELKRRIVWLCGETSGQFLPQMLGYDKLGAVNFHKGCYPGQEIVARTHYLGKVKRHPRLLHTTATICPDPMDKIQILGDNKSYAAITADCSHREDGGSCLFVVTRMDPELTADKIEYLGQITPLIQP